MSLKPGMPGSIGPPSDPEEKYMSGSPSFVADQCKLTVDHSYTRHWTYNNTSSNYGGKITIDFGDVDPNSISAVTDYQYSRYEVVLKTSTTSIKLASINPGEDFGGSVVSIGVTSLEGRASVEKAIRHTVKLCGGKPSKF
jgi:hypothetical protein